MEFPTPDRPSTWVPFRARLCDGCRAGCCRLPVEVTTEDLIRLELVSRDEAEGSLKKVARRLEREGVVASFRARTGLFILQQRPSRDGFGDECLYLGAKDRRCTVYERRPEVCRRFPTEIGPRVGYCPANPLPRGRG